MDIPGSFVALGALLLTGGIGWIAIHLMRTGFDYASSRGNPRNRAQAHESLVDQVKGAGLILGGPALAALVWATIKVAGG